jgi:hypothetical protein
VIREIRKFFFGTPGVHWTRVVMDRQVGDFVFSPGYRSRSCLEISGSKWKDSGFASYRSVSYPGFDICSDTTTEQYDMIIAEQVLEHVLYPRKAALNLRRMLRPGGMLAVTTPFLLRLHPDPEDCGRWTEKGLRCLLAESGFADSGIITGSWGNRECVKANLDKWQDWVPWRHSLRNEPAFPVVVWAFTRG